MFNYVRYFLLIYVFPAVGGEEVKKKEGKQVEGIFGKKDKDKSKDKVMCVCII